MKRLISVVTIFAAGMFLYLFTIHELTVTPVQKNTYVCKTQHYNPPIYGYILDKSVNEYIASYKFKSERDCYNEGVLDSTYYVTSSNTVLYVDVRLRVVLSTIPLKYLHK